MIENKKAPFEGALFVTLRLINDFITGTKKPALAGF